MDLLASALSTSAQDDGRFRIDLLTQAEAPTPEVFHSLEGREDSELGQYISDQGHIAKADLPEEEGIVKTKFSSGVDIEDHDEDNASVAVKLSDPVWTALPETRNNNEVGNKQPGEVNSRNTNQKKREANRGVRISSNSRHNAIYWVMYRLPTSRTQPCRCRY